MKKIFLKMLYYFSSETFVLFERLFDFISLIYWVKYKLCVLPEMLHTYDLMF